MSTIILPDRWRIQPVGTGDVDLDPRWASIIAFASLTGRPPIKDVKTKTAGAIFGTINRVVTTQGYASQPSSAGFTRASWTGLKPVAAMGDGYAILVLASPTTGAVKRAFSLGDEASSAYNQSTLMINADRNTSAASGCVSLIEYSNEMQARCETDASVINGRWHVFIGQRPAGNSAPSVYVDGANRTSASSASAGAAFTSGVHIHGQPTSTSAGYAEPLALAVVFNRALSGGEISELSLNPWQICRKSPGRVYFFPSAAGGATDGSLSKTVDAVTLSATGAVDVAGSLSKSVANVTLSAAGAVDVVGTLAKSLANVTLVSAGTIDLVGTLSANVAAVTLSSAGSVSDGPSGSLSVVLANVGVSATGTVDISGSSSFTVGSVSLSATGGVDVTGTLSATTGSVTLSSAGTVGTTVSEGVLSATIANVSVVSAGTVSVSGTLSSTLADVTLVAYESVVVPPAQTTGGGGSRPILIREKSLRDELSELRKQRMEAALLRQIQREDEEIVLIMAALAA